MLIVYHRSKRKETTSRNEEPLFGNPLVIRTSITTTLAELKVAIWNQISYWFPNGKRPQRYPFAFIPLSLSHAHILIRMGTDWNNEEFVADLLETWKLLEVDDRSGAPTRSNTPLSVLNFMRASPDLTVAECMPRVRLTAFS